MSTGSAVDAWFSELLHPLKPILLRVREIIRNADDRICEAVSSMQIQALIGRQRTV